MKPFSQWAYQKTSSLVYHLIQAIDQTLWMPSRVSETLAFRSGWKAWIKPSATSHKAKLWIHGASVGELEDLAAFFLSDTALHQAGISVSQVMVTASSVSAEDRLLKWSKMKPFLYCGPLPPDTKNAAEEFLTFFEPEHLLLSHNDFWPNLFLRWRKKRYAKNFFWYFKPKAFTSQRNACFESMKPFRLDRRVIGNLRLDRILARIQEARQTPHILKEWNVCPQSDKTSILVGSCRIEDAQMIAQLDDRYFENWQWVILPHNSDIPEEVAQINQWIGHKTKIIATQGILLEAYKDFDFAWIGGGYSRSGSHNALEALAWGVPVVCGPNTTPQLDTSLYANKGALKIIQNVAAMEGFLSHEDFRAMKPHAEALAIELARQESGIEKLSKVIREQFAV